MQLEAYLSQHGVSYEKHHHAIAYTAQGLAQAEGVSGYAVAKPVVVKGAKGFAMCVVPAPRHVDLKRVGTLLDDPAVRLATEAEMSGLFPDCELGAEPPIGPMFGMPTIVDHELEADDYVVMQAGTHTDAVKLRRSDWERVCKSRSASIAG